MLLKDREASLDMLTALTSQEMPFNELVRASCAEYFLKVVSLPVRRNSMYKAYGEMYEQQSIHIQLPPLAKDIFSAHGIGLNTVF